MKRPNKALRSIAAGELGRSLQENQEEDRKRNENCLHRDDGNGPFLLCFFLSVCRIGIEGREKTGFCRQGVALSDRRRELLGQLETSVCLLSRGRG